MSERRGYRGFRAQASGGSVAVPCRRPAASRGAAALRSAVLALAALGAMAGGAWADQYGTAVVEAGGITIIRDGRSLSFQASPQPVAVNELDLVRVREASRMVLKTEDHATITLGANAVFQCEPWQTPSKAGVFRMLFGRFRASIAGLAGNERFNVKTATATIGVKGTEYSLAETSLGNTAVLGIENHVTNAGRDGVDQDVGPNQVSVVIAGNPASPSVSAPDLFKREMGNLNAPNVTSPGARDLPAENSLINAGIVSKDTLDKSKTGGQPPSAPPAPPTPQTPFNIYDAQQQSGLKSGTLNLHLEK